MENNAVCYYDVSDYANRLDRLVSCNIKTQILDVAEIEKGMMVADIGASKGMLTETILAAGARVIAIDQAGNVMEGLKGKYASTDAISFGILDNGLLPIPDQSVDRVFCSMFLHHTDYPGMVISEMKRILKPGGRFVITDMETHDKEYLRENFSDLWLGFYTSDIRHWLQRGGFSNIIVGTIPGQRSFPSLCSFFEGISIFMATGTS